MKIKIKQPLPFILKQGLTEFEINFVNGFYVLRTQGFKQNLKKSEYDKIMDNVFKENTLPFPETTRGKRK